MELDVYHKTGDAVVPKSYTTYHFDQPNKYIQLCRVKIDSPQIPRASSKETENENNPLSRKKQPSFEMVNAVQRKNQYSFPRLLMQHSGSTTSLGAFQRKGKILSDDQFEAIWLFLPQRYQIGRFSLIFSTADDGISIRTFLDRASGYPASVTIIRTTLHEIFGAFCSEDWNKRHESRKDLNFFGTGESFLFTCKPRNRIYPWVGWTSHIGEGPSHYQSLFMAANSETIVIGGGGGGSGIRFNSDLSRGRSESCSTFDNQPLCQGGDFFTSAIEVYGLLP